MVYLRPPTVPLSTTQGRRSVQQCPLRSPDCLHGSACRTNPGQRSSTTRSSITFGQLLQIWGSRWRSCRLCDRLGYACPPRQPNVWICRRQGGSRSVLACQSVVNGRRCIAGWRWAGFACSCWVSGGRGGHGRLPAAHEAQLTALELAAFQRPARRRQATGSLRGARLIAGCGAVAAPGSRHAQRPVCGIGNGQGSACGSAQPWGDRTVTERERAAAGDPPAAYRADRGRPAAAHLPRARLR